MTTRSTMKWVAVAALLGACACPAQEEARREGPDPELMELRRLQAEVARAPSVKEVMAADSPVDLSTLPEKPIVPPGVVVKEREPEPEVEPAPPAVAPTEPLEAEPVLGDSVDVGALVRAAQAEAPLSELPAAAQSGPMQACVSLYGKCRGKGWGTDVCVRDLPRCEQTSPTVAGPTACCPGACMDGYAQRRRGGQSFEAAGRATFTIESGGCLQALAAPPPDQAAQPAPAQAPAPGQPPATGAVVPVAVQPVAAPPVAAPRLAAPAPQPVRAAPPTPQAGGAAVESEPQGVQSQPIP